MGAGRFALEGDPIGGASGAASEGVAESPIRMAAQRYRIPEDQDGETVLRAGLPGVGSSRRLLRIFIGLSCREAARCYLKLPEMAGRRLFVLLFTRER